MSVAQPAERVTSCPSWLELDRWRLGELTAQQGARLGEHTRDCEHCAARLRQEAADFVQSVSLGRLRVAVSRHAPIAKKRAALAPLMAAAACALIAVAWHGPTTERRAGAHVRSKGGDNLSLRVLEERAGRMAPLEDGIGLVPGERLRFEVRVPAGKHFLIMGIEASGKHFTYYPEDARSTLSELSGTQLLQGAAELDESLGAESIVLVACPVAFSLPERSQPLPEGCQRSSLSIHKVAQ